MQAKLKHTIQRNDFSIPAGTVLDFALENGQFAMYRGQKIDIYSIPTAAFESAPVANNTVNTESQFVDFEELEPGMLGSSKEGEPIRILGKAVGQTGYDALVKQFGNVDEITFEQLTSGFSDDEINELKLIAYSDKDGQTHVGFYGTDYATVSSVNAATENGNAVDKDFEDVIPTDIAIDKDGNKFTVLGTGVGKVWFEKTAEAYSIEQTFDAFAEMLDDEETGDDMQFMLVKDDKGTMSIVCYCPEKGATVKVENPAAEASVEAINAAAKHRWENGGAELYARLTAKFAARQAALESITIYEEDDTIRQNIEHDLSENGIEYDKTEDNKIVVKDDDDSNVEYLSSIAPIYVSVKNGLADAGIESYTGYSRK